jgi:hypothetical protein
VLNASLPTPGSFDRHEARPPRALYRILGIDSILRRRRRDGGGVLHARALEAVTRR